VRIQSYFGASSYKSIISMKLREKFIVEVTDQEKGHSRGDTKLHARV